MSATKFVKFLAALLVLLAPAFAFEIQCSFYTYTYVAPIGSLYECWSRQNDFTAADQTATAVKGTYAAGKTSADVKGLFVYDSPTLAFVPRGVAQLFPQVVSLWLTGTSIAALDGHELDELAQLKAFYLTNSKVARISSLLFSNTPHVVVVNFWHNQLAKVGADLFAPLTLSSVVVADFQDNACISRAASNLTAVTALVAELKTSCRYDDEFVTTTTEGAASCEMKAMLEELQGELTAVKEQLAAAVGELTKAKSDLALMAADFEEFKAESQTTKESFCAATFV